MIQEKKIDELLFQLSQDKQFIEERQKERQERYLKSTKLYLKSIQKETDIIEKTKESHQKRNESFENQIKDVYNRYQSGSFKLVDTFRKTSKSKIQFNDSVLTFYPQQLRDQRQNLEDNIETLQKRLEELQEINKKENIDYYKVLEKKYQTGVTSTDQIRQERHRLEQEINQTRQYLMPQSQTQSYIKPAPVDDSNLNVKVRKPSSNLSQRLLEENPDQIQEQQQQMPAYYQAAPPPRPPMPQSQMDMTNLEQYAGLRPNKDLTKQRQEAQKILDEFTHPVQSKKLQQQPLKFKNSSYQQAFLQPQPQYQQRNLNYSQENSADFGYNMNEQYPQNQEQIMEGGFREDQSERQTFNESTEKQSIPNNQYRNSAEGSRKPSARKQEFA